MFRISIFSKNFTLACVLAGLVACGGESESLLSPDANPGGDSPDNQPVPSQTVPPLPGTPTPTPGTTPTATPAGTPTPTATPVAATPTPAPRRARNNDEAVRFLLRTTFGPTQREIDALQATNYTSWLQQQFDATPTYQTETVRKLIDENARDFPFLRSFRRSDAWFDTVINGEDQLRQRVAFALSQILVVSENEGVLVGYARSMANYNDVLIRNAFGNFRELLEEVTLHPAMGNFLSMRRNSKGNDEGTIQPDENYAREIMQLFTIGLKELNLDGTEKLDSRNRSIPTYGMPEVLAFARVFTGWNYENLRRFQSGFERPDSERLLKPMTPYEDFHDTGEKVLLNGTVLPANQDARTDLEMALDNLFNHPNVGPFIGKQLIQRLVTSNPSSAYVARVASVFNDNGRGVRGDLQATVRAILLDSEALLGYQNDPQNFGKLKEPLLKLTHLWRAFGAEGAGGHLRYSQSNRDFAQKALAAPSVFNFFSPTFSQPGAIENGNMVSPEFQIYTETTAISAQNRLRSYINGSRLNGTRAESGLHQINLNFDRAKRLANRPEELVKHFNDFLFAGQMSQQTQDILEDFINQTPMTDDGTLRVREGLFLAFASPDFAYQR